MDTKKQIKKGTDTHNLMDKLFAKFKMTKHGEEKQSDSKCGKSIQESDESPSLTELKPQIMESKPKVTPEKIIEFSETLHQLLENVQAVKEFTLATFDIPELNKRLEEEAIELRDLYRKVQEAALDIERLKKHRYLIKKEKSLASKKLDKLKDEEIRELESIIYTYAKPLYSKWESIKNTQKMDVVENFMNEMTGKQRAIEILQELVRRKLSKISKKIGNPLVTVQKNVSSSNLSNKNQKQDKNMPNWNITPLPDTDKFNQTVDKVMRGPTDREILKMNRRKRQKLMREERRRVNHENSSSSNADNNSNGLELHLVPIDHFRNEEADEELNATKPTAAATAGNRTSPVINIEFMYDTDSVSMSSSDLTLENFAQSGNSEPQQELQREMRTVLQALFGEIRQMPQIRSYPNRNRCNINNGNDLRPSRTGSN